MNVFRQRYVRVLFVLGALVALGVVIWGLKSRQQAQVPSLVGVENMGNLVSVKVHYADVIDFTLHRAIDVPQTPWEIRYAGTHVLLIAKGDCAVATDLRFAKHEAVDRNTHRVTIRLAAPATLYARVDHASPERGGSRLFAVLNEGLEALIPDQTHPNKAIDAAYAKAQAQVAAACKSPDVINTARENTEAVLRQMFAASGWDVTFEWGR
jgi:hypothetical protein